MDIAAEKFGIDEVLGQREFDMSRVGYSGCRKKIDGVQDCNDGYALLGAKIEP